MQRSWPAPRGGRSAHDALVEAAPGLGDRPLDLGERRGRDLGDDRLVGRVLDGERLVALDPRARDVRAAFGDDRSPPRTSLVCRTVFYLAPARKSTVWADASLALWWRGEADPYALMYRFS